MKVKLMKQNKNTPVVRVASAALAAFVLYFSLCLPSFATSTNGIDFSDQPLYESSSFLSANSSNFDLCVPAYENNSNIFAFYVTPWGNADSGDIYMFYVPSVGVYGSLYFAGINSMSVYRMTHSKSNPNSYNASSSPSVNTGTVDSITGLVYGRVEISGNAPTVISCPSYNSLADGLADVSALTSGGASHSLSTSLPSGNAIIIDISGNAGEVISLSTSSALRHKSPWSDGNQTMNYTDTAPSSISTPYGSTISWTGSGNPNLFGGYNTWILNGPLNPTKSYLVIVNPAYPNDNPDSITSNQASNGPIHISCAYCKGYTFVPLSSYWNNGSIANESGSTRLDGEYDESTQSWVTTNPATGEPQNPVSGGMTDVDAEHITINDWLQNISHQIGSFFSGAIGAVSNLVGAGSDFIQSLSSLYSWLPGPVYAVLSSALILVITIGVIKVFI